MKKLLSILVMSLLFFSNVNSEERDIELNIFLNNLKIVKPQKLLK